MPLVRPCSEPGCATLTMGGRCLEHELLAARRWRRRAVVLSKRLRAPAVAVGIAACAGLIAGGPGLVSTVAGQPVRVITLLALTLALQMFSVQVYGRGSVSVSAIGIVASAILFDTGTSMGIAALAAVA